MGTTTSENDASEFRIPPAMFAAAVEGAARSPLGETEMLGFFEGLTDKGFRLVWEDGALLLVVYSTNPLDSTLVADIRQRLQWPEENRTLVQERLRVVIGPEAIMPNCDVRVVVREADSSEEAELSKLPSRIELISFSFKSDAEGIALRPLRKTLGRRGASGQQPGSDAVAVIRPPSSEATNNLERYLLELRRSAIDANSQDRWIDPADWRCSPTLNLLRVYALLVTIAASLTLPVSTKRKPASTSRFGTETNPPAETQAAKVLEFLGLFAGHCAQKQFRPKDFAAVLGEVTAFVDEQMPDRAIGSQGAYLGPAWKSPVPPQISSLISSMGGATTPTERADALAAAKGATAKLLEEANFGIASCVHIAQTYDNRGWPEPPVEHDHVYLQGALSRVLAAHRLLLDLVGVKSRPAWLAMLGLAEEIAIQETFSAFWAGVKKGNRRSVDYLQTTRQGSLAVLSGSGRMASVGKNAGTLGDIAESQQNIVLGAMNATSQLGVG
jgi:hypothetical protein